MILVLINGKAKFAKQYGPERLTQDVQHALGQAGKAALTHSLEHLEETLRGHDPQSISAIVPFGGDGTVSVALTTAMRVYGADRLPRFLAIKAGTMNEIATEIGTLSRNPLQDIAALGRLMKSGEGIPTTHRYPMVINGERLGFAFGFGASSRFLERYYAAGAGVLVALRMVATYVGSALIMGSTIRNLFKPVTGRLVHAQGSAPMAWTFCLALTVRKLPFGVLLSTSGGPNARPVMCVVAGAPKLIRLALCLPLIWIGRLPKWIGLTRTEYTDLRVELDEPMAWHIDGDVCAPSTHIEIVTGPKVHFIELKRALKTEP
ncbi:MAG TPA: diacylglycerol kinase family protein [Limnobacter sp.]|uniref:diacylglycerol/lipid kinase family protein n=1 Tax=Limnobacter sp. TaxID=2003368 RepID=UPI002ED82428